MSPNKKLSRLLAQAGTQTRGRYATIARACAPYLKVGMTPLVNKNQVSP